MTKYIELAINTPANRGIIIPVSEFRTQLAKANKLRQPIYRSYYSFDEEIKDHFQRFKTVRSYKGKFYLDHILIDIDRGKDSDEFVLQRARAFVQKLQEDWELDKYNISIWYSGTGYHVIFPDIFEFEPSVYLPSEVRATIMNFFPDMDDKPLISTGLIRTGYSFNSKSGLFKIPLTYDELYSLNVINIMNLAKDGSPRTNMDEWDKEPPKIFHNMIVKNAVRRTEEFTRTEPTRIVTCVQKIFLEGPVAGTRHDNLLRLVSRFRLQGVPYEGVLALAREWNANSISDYELIRQVKYAWDKGYTPGCMDTVLAKYCDPKCTKFAEKNLETTIVSARSLEKQFMKFRRSDFSLTSFSLNEFYYLPDPYDVFPGEMVVIIGDTGVNKTALVQNWIINLKRLKTLFCSLEVHDNLYYRRNIQIAHNMTKNEVNAYYEKNENTLSEAVEHIDMIFDPITTDKLLEMVKKNDYRIVVIDVVDAMKVKKTSDYNGDKTEQLANEIKQLANKGNCIVICIHHISKEAARNGTLTKHSGKGSSAIEQKADKLIGVELSSTDPNVRIIKNLKARDEVPFYVPLLLNPETFVMAQHIVHNITKDKNGK